MTENEPLDFCLINEAIRKADSIERLNALAKIIAIEIALDSEWSRDARNVEHLRKEWRRQKTLVEKQAQPVNL